MFKLSIPFRNRDMINLPSNQIWYTLYTTIRARSGGKFCDKWYTTYIKAKFTDKQNCFLVQKRAVTDDVSQLDQRAGSRG